VVFCERSHGGMDSKERQKSEFEKIQTKFRESRGKSATVSISVSTHLRISRLYSQQGDMAKNADILRELEGEMKKFQKIEAGKLIPLSAQCLLFHLHLMGMFMSEIDV